MGQVVRSEAARTAPQLSGSRTEADGRRPRVLIVDDDHHSGHSLELLLAGEGFVVGSASSAADALTAVAAHPPDLIVLCLAGVVAELAATLKADADTEKIRILLITATDDRKAGIVGLGAGADDFIVRPVDGSELVARIRSRLPREADEDFVDRYSVPSVGTYAPTGDLASEGRYRRIVETTNRGIWVTDRLGRTEFMNERMASMLGYARHEVIGLPFLDFVDAESAPGSRDGAVEDHRPRQTERQLRAKTEPGSGS